MAIEDFINNATKRVAKRSETSEADIEQAFCKYAKGKGCQALKLVILRKKGFPDRTVFCPKGRVLFIEFKRIGKKPSPAQIIMKKLLESLGFEYHVCDRIGQAEGILEEFLEWS